MSLQTGQPAPGFTLFDTEKNEISLSSFKGENVLLLFFPLAFTGVCTKELCAVRDTISLYKNASASVLGISVDSIFTLEKFKQEQQLPFTLLSDFNKEVSAAYGSLYTAFKFGMKGVSKRSAFVIDKEGIIRYAEVLENAGDIPDFEKITAVLNSLI